MRYQLYILPLATILCLPALAQEQPKDEPMRQLGAHAHGTAKLGIAFERRTVEMELEAPAADIVGFEHAAKTAEQKQAMAQARATLAKPLALFRLPDAAGCKVTSAKVKFVGGGSHDHGHSHGHSHGKSAKGKEPDTHAEFHAEYTLNCAKPELVQSIMFDYFKSFPRAEALDITVVGGKGQAAKLKATRDKPQVDLKGTS